MAETDKTHQTQSKKKADFRQEVLILLGALLFIAAWAGCVVIWGLPGLYIPAVLLVPVVYLLLVVGSRG